MKKGFRCCKIWYTLRKGFSAFVQGKDAISWINRYPDTNRWIAIDPWIALSVFDYSHPNELLQSNRRRNPTYVYEIGFAIYNSSSQSSYLFIGVVMETISYLLIERGETGFNFFTRRKGNDRINIHGGNFWCALVKFGNFQSLVLVTGFHLTEIVSFQYMFHLI